MTNTLAIVATIIAEPGHEGAVEAALRNLLAPTRAEPGCLSYNLHVSPTDPRHFVMIESWRDQAAFDAHLAMPHFQDAGGALDGKASLAIQPLTPIG